ncbi:MAG: DNA polymerase III subunit gamma/tau [Clostridia bacterium]|nr:DNA polymerase III subunit gamma/tau [Clostridia bacterium]
MSSYQALYRKFRPQTFEYVIGQEHIVKTLKNQIKSGRVSHAYLFCGTRGTGKTSTAKIFAKAINCLNPVDGEPCNECELCLAANEGRSVNVIEIDAASNNGVDNIREIREEVKYPPAEGKYKVYIIDEVHMLSPGAYNALLKTLEEPPKHVIFILATTDPQKIPATILSRCQRFDFRRIGAAEIAETLKGYAAQEGIEADDEALYLVARLGDGSMRDSLSILDQCTAFYYGERLTKDKVLEIVGSVDDSVLFEMTDKIAERDADALMNTVDELMKKGRDAGQFTADYITHLRNLMITSSVSDAEKILNVSSESAKALKEQAGRISKEEISRLIKVFSELSADMKYASNKRVLLEVCLIKLCTPVTEADYTAVAAKLASIERALKSGKYTKTVVSGAQAETEPAPKPKKTVRKAETEDYKKALEIWKEVASGFAPPNDIIVKKAELKQLDGDKIFVVADNTINSRILSEKLNDIKAALIEKLGAEPELEVLSKNEYKKRYEMIFGSPEEQESSFDEEDWAGLIPGIEIEP